MHNGSLNKLYNRLTAVLKLRMTPQAEGSSVVLHSSVVGDTLRSETEAQDVTRIRTVSYQERTIWFPFQLHLCIFPIHWPPIPTTLLQLSKAGCKAARVRPIERTLEVLWGLAVQGFSCSDGSNPGKCICEQGAEGDWRKGTLSSCQPGFPPRVQLPARRTSHVCQARS